MHDKFYITKSGLEKLEQEIKYLKTKKRPEVIDAISHARDYGDLSENAEYTEAKREQSMVEGRIAELEDKLSRAEVIDISKLSGDSVKFGATVGLIDCNNEQNVSYQIVSTYEADLGNNKLSIMSPLAKALIGKIIGDYIELQTPKGLKEYEIMSVDYLQD